ncbi:MAG TPA: NAD(P)H-dependent oxidoreductase [Gemmatimonadales bacterium]|jgi:chromate reductase
MARLYNIAVLVGSLRRDSVTRKVAHAMIQLAPSNLALRELELASLAMYNEDLEADVPPAWAAFRDDIKRTDGVLFFTPEYNRSVPGVLKNAIDIGSRPGGHGVWSGKPGGVVSVTPFGLGAFGANHHLRQALVYVNVLVMAQPEAYISQASTLIGADGTVTNETSRAFFTKFMAAYADWVERLA